MKTLKNKAKKGFTIVELVIVIAVIAILAAVLIPTFTNVVESANESAAMQESRNEWTEYLVEIAADGQYTDATYYLGYKSNTSDTTDKYVFEVVDGVFNTEPVDADTSNYVEIKYTYTCSNDKITIYAPSTTTVGNQAITATQKETNAQTAVSALLDAVIADSTLNSVSTNSSYYVKMEVTSSTTVYYFQLTLTGTSGTTLTDWTVVASTASAYGTATGTALTVSGYTVAYVSVS